MLNVLQSQPATNWTKKKQRRYYSRKKIEFMQTGGGILFNYTEADTSFIYTRAYYKLANMLLLVK